MRKNEMDTDDWYRLFVMKVQCLPKQQIADAFGISLRTLTDWCNSQEYKDYVCSVMALLDAAKGV